MGSIDGTNIPTSVLGYHAQDSHEGARTFSDSGKGGTSCRMGNGTGQRGKNI
jgi:hypothetical protein